LYFHNNNSTEKYVLPAYVTYPGRVFLDVNLDRIDANGNLMDVETLNYFQKFASEISQAGDNLQVGVNLTVNIDKTGRMSPTGATYTDTNINLRARAYNWSIISTPTYIGIGSGDLSKKYPELWNFSVDIKNKKEREQEYKSYWNYDVYDDVGLTEEVLDNLNKLGVIGDKEDVERSIYFAKTISELTQGAKDTISSLDIPLFESALGEREVYMNKMYSDKISYTVINAVIKRAQITNKSQKNFDDIVF
jgi:hypothetical protein